MLFLEFLMSHSYGFSLRDLQATIAILGMLAAMLLPAIQKVREDSREIVCQKRLTEIARSAQFFEVANQRLPTQLTAVGAVSVNDWLDFSPNPDSVLFNQNTSPLVELSPFLGLQFDNVDPIIFDFDNNLLADLQTFGGLYNLWFSGDFGTAELMGSFEEFECPSDNVNKFAARASSFNQALFVSDPDAEDFSSPVVFDGPDGSPIVGGRTNFVACNGASTGGDNRGGQLGNHRGATGYREFRSTETIPDGASNTVLYGENIGTIQQSVDGTFERNFTRFWFLGAASRGRGGVGFGANPPLNTTVGNTNPFFEIYNAGTPEFPNPDVEPDPRQGILGSAFHARDFGFGSMHPDVVNFVMLDGSIRSITRTDDWKTLYGLFGAFDGQPTVGGFDLRK